MKKAQSLGLNRGFGGLIQDKIGSHDMANLTMLGIIGEQ